MTSEVAKVIAAKGKPEPTAKEMVAELTSTVARQTAAIEGLIAVLSNAPKQAAPKVEKVPTVHKATKATVADMLAPHRNFLPDGDGNLSIPGGLRYDVVLVAEKGGKQSRTTVAKGKGGPQRLRGEVARLQAEGSVVVAIEKS